jgi:hypothetical protein
MIPAEIAVNRVSWPYKKGQTRTFRASKRPDAYLSGVYARKFDEFQTGKRWHEFDSDAVLH